MKSLVEFLSDLRGRGITLAVKGEKLICNAPKNAVTEEIREELAGRKADILEFLRSAHPLPAPERAEISLDEVPLSHSQLRLWFVTQLDPQNPVYNVVIALWLNGELKRDALERSLLTIVERHESLRTGFLERNGQPFSKVTDAADWSMAFADLGDLDSPEAEVEAERIAYVEARRPFNLEQAPLFRATLLQISAEKALLVLAIHHIVADGWSLGILSHELTQLYAAFTSGKPSPLAALSFQFRDYVQWERDTGKKAADQQIPYWLERLSGELPVLDLPADKRRPSQQTFNGRRIAITIDESLTQRVRELSQQTGTTVFMVLLAAFKALLLRYTGIEDILVGSGTSNRQRQEFSGLIGFFVNNLVLRTDLSGNPSFADLLRRVLETATAAYAHQDVPFERLVETLRPDRALSRSPLVQVMFTFQNLPMPEIYFGGIKAELAQIDHGIARADLSVEVWSEQRGYRCDFEYNTDIFDEKTIRQLQSHYVRFLDAAVADPSLSIRRVPLLSKEEREQLVTTWNQTESPYPRIPVHTIFEEWVRRTPDTTALSTGEGTVSYRQLDAMANAVAHRILSLGVAPGSFVAVCAGSSAARIAAFLGILKAGAAYLPLGPQDPAERMAYMIEDAGATVLLAERALANRLPRSSSVLILEDILADPGSAAPQANVQAEDPAYLMYTSGSTGKPKGVVIPHRGIVRLVRNTDYAHFGPNEVFLELAPVSFDASTFEIWGALLNGARLVLLPEDQRDPESIKRAIESQGVTTLWLTAALFHFMVAEHIEALAPLKQLLAGGDVLSPVHVQRLLKYAPNLHLINGYGPTENTTFTCCHRVKTASPEGGSVPIGRPINNTRVYLLDDFGQPVPLGVSAELYAAGDGLALGYRNAPELTAAKFVTRSLGSGEPERLYRTGDVARYRPDGTIEFLGRTDKQVKLRGYRIELSEIEEALVACTGVSASVASVRREEDGNQRLIAYVVVKDGSEWNAQRLRDELKTKLATQCVPNHFFRIPVVPVTSNGKVDFAALDALPLDSAREEVLARPAANGIETRLAQIFAEVLKLESVAVGEDFFALGGHSLLAMQLISWIDKEFRVQIPVAAIFQRPTVESLARLIAVEGGSSETSTVSPAERSSVQEGEHPLSRSQQRLWFLDQLNPGNAVYNIPIPVRFTGPLPRRALELAIKTVLNRHESLRTSFFEKDGIPYVTVERADDWEMGFVDFSDIADGREDKLQRYIEEEAGRPFALDRGPLFRTSIVRTAPDEHTLILVVHHIVFDGWSIGVLAQEMVELTQAFLEERDSVLSPPRFQFRDFVVWEQQQESTRNFQMEYWKKRLAGELPLLELPTDYRRPPLQSFRGGRCRMVIANELIGRLERLSREQNATLYMVLFAAFNVLLLHYSRQEDILVGTPTAGRLKKEFENLIGFFVNNLVLRTDLGGNPSFVDLIARVQKTALEAFEYQSVPFDQLVDELQPERGLDRSPIFQVLFTLQNTPMPKTRFAGVEMSVIEFQTYRARYDLAVDIYPRENEYLCDFEYSTDLFEEDTVQQMQRHYLRLLEAAAADPDQLIGSLPLLSDAERRLILEDWNATESATPVYATVAEWFRAQAVATPDSTAVMVGEQDLSYAGLNEQSDLLAEALRKRGVGRGVIVGLYVTRSLNMVVGLLAILKAGGAYLPLDPAFPAERIEFLLSDADVPLILTEISLIATLSEINAALLVIDDAWDEPQELPIQSSDDEELPRAQDLAYMIYTSGSTGKPKGTEITHGALVNLLSSMLREPGLRQQDTLVAVTTLSFDIAGLEIFGPLMCGAKLVLASREQAVDPQALVELLEETGATVLQATPSNWRMLVESGWMGKPDLRMWCGGEALPPDLADSLLMRGRELWNLYGPTETTIWSAAHRVSSSENPILIGRPIANTQMYILNTQGLPVPIGVAGELYIAGDGVARGYWKRPELTASRFVADPFSKKPNGRMYRTGDLARYRRDGQIQLLGRTDQQIKLRGHRIELGEIEAAIEHHAGVQQAVVALNGEGAGQRLIAYVKQAHEMPANDLRTWLRQRLPEYMVPAVFISLPELPLTPNGKIDRKRLPAPEDTVRLCTAESVVPRNQTERTLAGIWSNVLRISAVGVRDNFFDLGGQSLLLIKVHAKLRQELDPHIPVVDLFRYPTIESMAAHLERRHQAAVAEGVSS